MERILVCSDIHRYKDNFWEAYQRCAPVDRIIISGDIEDYPENYYAMAQMTPLVMVQGNCDYYLGNDLPSVAEFDLEGRHFFVTHGHLFQVGGGKPKALLAAAKKAKADIVIFGHTHQALYQTWDGICCINPGALRGSPSSGSCSYAILTLDKNNPEIKVDFFHLS